MKPNYFRTHYLPAVATFLFTILMIMSSCQKAIENTSSLTEVAGVSKDPKALKDFEQVNLVGNNDEYDPLHIDPNLINGWGIAFPTSGPAWVNAEGTGLSILYNQDGTQPRVPVAIPSPAATTGGHPTGIVFNPTTDFKLPNGNPARFIFAGADGVISGWNTGNFAIRMNTPAPGNVYLGLANGAAGTNNYLYAANFSQGRIDVFNKDWQPVSMPFTDPNMPAGYSPFNIQNIEGMLYVMYAKVNLEEHEEEVGPGLGYIDIYTTGGVLVKRFISRGQLNAPWGIAKAPAGFWDDDSEVQNVILVGNFGDGRINAFDENGQFLGQLRSHGNPVIIEGLWAITFAPSTSTVINRNWLFFAAGPDDEEEGLFGYIKK